MSDYIISATCTFGLESVLKREIIKLGYEIINSSEGIVSIKGNIQDVFTLNLWLRCANRILINLCEFDANTFDELFDNTAKFNWQDYIPKNAKFNVEKITCVKSKLFSKSDCQRIIKKAIVDKLMKSYKVKTLSEKGANYPLFVSIKNDKAHLYLNTSGESLHRRGYSLLRGEAPIKETLAAGIIRLSGYEGENPFADVMCGSGTIILEAALIGANIAPGINRTFAFEEWGMLKNKNSILDEAKDKIKFPDLRLLGSDINPSVLKSANENAKRAGVDSFVSFQKMDFTEFKSRKKNGIMIINPPYGERLEKDINKLKLLYQNLRNVYDNLDNWKLFVISGNEEFERYFGLKANKNRKLYNGNMLTYLYQYFPKF